jgi:predicted DCC family thiol-disulfide oxidoreductase YuxK
MNSATNSSKHTAAIREADFPTNVLFFDGVCGLCNRSVDFLLSRDRRGAIRFAPLQGETAKRVLSAEWLVNNSENQTFDTIVWLDSSGREFVRSAATVRVLWRLGGVWWLIGWSLWLIPRPLRDIGYRLVAANRFRWFGKKETCRLPAPTERERFLP